jgi:integrase
MRPILNIPEEIIIQNRAGVEQMVNQYVGEEWDAMDDTHVTSDYADHPISYFGDDYWDLGAYVDSKITYKSKMSFTDIHSQLLIREFKLICFSWLYVAGNARISRPSKPTTLIERHSKLRQIYKYLDTKKFDSITVLNHPIIFSEFCEHLRSSLYSTSQLSHIFGALKSIEKMSNHLPLSLNIPTDDTSYELGKRFASPLKMKGNQFYAIPTRLMQKIYTYILDLVDTYHPHKEELHYLLSDLRKNYEMGKKAVDDKIASGKWQWLNSDSPEYRVEVNKHKPFTYAELIESNLEGSPLNELLPKSIVAFENKISLIKVACVMTCAAFTGMRRSELYGLHVDSFSEQEFNGNKFYYLKSVQHKMTQGPGKKTAWITSPKSRYAIELAEALNRHLSAQLMMHEDPSKRLLASCLLLTQSVKSKPPTVKFEGMMRSYFNRVAENSGAYIEQEDIDEFHLINPNCNSIMAGNKISVGKLWPITTHQFRRTFAVFAKRHNLCSDVAIKQQFKHIYLPMAEWYGEGGIAARLQSLFVYNDLKSLLDEVSNEVTTQVIHQWYNSDQKLYGKMGQSIAKDREYVATHFSSWEAIKNQVEKGLITLVGTLHSYCMAGYDCKMEKSVSPSYCFNCENIIIDEEKAQAWKERHNWIVTRVSELQSTGQLTHSIYSHFITQIRAAEQVMAYFKIPFKRLEINL